MNESDRKWAEFKRLVLTTSIGLTETDLDDCRPVRFAAGSCVIECPERVAKVLQAVHVEVYIHGMLTVTFREPTTLKIQVSVPRKTLEVRLDESLVRRVENKAGANDCTCGDLISAATLAYLDSGQADPSKGWISVNEDLPPVDERVMVLVSGKGGTFGRDAIRTGRLDSEGIWRCPNALLQNSRGTARAWRRLPGLPSWAVRVRHRKSKPTVSPAPPKRVNGANGATRQAGLGAPIARPIDRGVN